MPSLHCKIQHLTEVVHWIGQLKGPASGVVPQNITPLVTNVSNDSVPFLYQLLSLSWLVIKCCFIRLGGTPATKCLYITILEIDKLNLQTLIRLWFNFDILLMLIIFNLRGLNFDLLLKSVTHLPLHLIIVSSLKVFDSKNNYLKIYMKNNI